MAVKEFIKVSVYSHVAVGVVYEVCHADEVVVEGLAGLDAALLVQSQHALQQVDELAAVHFLRQQLAALQIRRHVDLAT